VGNELLTANDRTLSSRPFVALTQDAKIARGNCLTSPCLLCASFSLILAYPVVRAHLRLKGKQSAHTSLGWTMRDLPLTKMHGSPRTALQHTFLFLFFLSASCFSFATSRLCERHSVPYPIFSYPLETTKSLFFHAWSSQNVHTSSTQTPHTGRRLVIEQKSTSLQGRSETRSRKGPRKGASSSLILPAGRAWGIITHQRLAG